MNLEPSPALPSIIAAPPDPPPKRAPAIKVIGVGRAGLQAVAHMQQGGLEGLTFAGAHTDARQLAQSAFEPKVLLGGSLTRGLGAGGDPDVGRAAAEAEIEALRALSAGQDLVIIVVGLGGGTGSGAAPVLARAAKENGALVLALAALPFEFEGVRRQQQAQQALRQLKTAADAVICLPNQRICGLIDDQTTLQDTLRTTNEFLTEGVRSLWRLVTQAGLINVDFADLCHVVRGRQAESCFASATAMGETRARELIDRLLSSTLLDSRRSLNEADAVLASLVGGPDLTLREVNLIMEQVNRACEHAQVVMGAAIDPKSEGRLSLTLIATRRSQSEAGEAPAAEPTAPEQAPQLDSEFPTDGSARARDAIRDEENGHPPSRFVPPPPSLTPAQTEQLLARQAGPASRRRNKTMRLQQGILPLEVVSKGRFAKSEPTLHRGEDLDTPTYIRRGVVLN